MLIVETIARIRREHFIKGKTIKEIARDLRVSRNTVRKVLSRERAHSSTSGWFSLGRSWDDGQLNSTDCWQGTRPSPLASS
jgi:orotate phosphoribosyltransferase-like protein